MSSACVHDAASRQACSSTHRPSGTIRPLDSATGMKESGPSSPRSGCCQRTSASTATGRPVATSTTGW